MQLKAALEQQPLNWLYLGYDGLIVQINFGNEALSATLETDKGKAMVLRVCDMLMLHERVVIA